MNVIVRKTHTITVIGHTGEAMIEILKDGIEISVSDEDNGISLSLDLLTAKEFLEKALEAMQ